jgi:hypothetical protein
LGAAVGGLQKRPTWFRNLGLFALVFLAANFSQAAPKYRVEFEQAQYFVPDGESFPVAIRIHPLPASSVFSFGVRIDFGRTNAEVTGVSAIQPVAELGFDGSKSDAPVVSFSADHAAAKGTARFQSQLSFSTNSLLVKFLVRCKSAGPFTLRLSPFNTLGVTEQIFVDGSGTVLDPDIEFGTATMQKAGGITIGNISDLLLNRQTGLFEHSVEIHNSGPPLPNGLRLLVRSLPDGWKIENATGTSGAFPMLVYPTPLLSGGVAVVRVEYRVPGRIPQGNPSYTAEVNIPFNPIQPPVIDSFDLIPRAKLSDGSILIEFSSLADRRYLVQYSSNLVSWRNVLPHVIGNGSRLQWIDYGPPKSETPPRSDTPRFYRVLLLK